MKRLADWIKRHQVAIYFALVYAITWSGFILIYRVFPGNQAVELLVGLPAMFSPASAAMLISAINEPRPRPRSRKLRWVAFIVSWLVSTLIVAAVYWQVEKLQPGPAMVIGGIVALLPAWIVSSAFARTPGIRKHFSTILRPRGSPLWYLVAVFAFPAIQLLGAGITRLLGGEVHFRLEGMGLGSAVVFLVLVFLRVFLFTGGINEESGWRGFALPRLQARYPVIVAIGIVWFFWSLWHLPFDLGGGSDIHWIILNRTLHMFLWSVFFAWVYNRTQGSILAPALFHSSMNSFGDYLVATPITTFIFIALAAFAIVHDRMWKKLPPDDPAVYPSPQIGTQPEKESTPGRGHELPRPSGDAPA